MRCRDRRRSWPRWPREVAAGPRPVLRPPLCRPSGPSRQCRARPGGARAALRPSGTGRDSRCKAPECRSPGTSHSDHSVQISSPPGRAIRESARNGDERGEQGPRALLRVIDSTLIVNMPALAGRPARQADEQREGSRGTIMTTESGANPTLRSYLVILRRRKWWIICAAVAGLAVSLAVALTQAKQYSASAQLLVQPSSQALAAGTTLQPVTPTEVQTELQLVTSAPVQLLVQRRLGRRPPVNAVQVAQTNVISISAIATTPALAARIANTYAQAFVTYQQTVITANMTAAEAQLRGPIRSIIAQITSLQHRPGAAAEVTALLNQEAVLKEQYSQLQVTGAQATAGAATGGVE